jgi:hypothetical protein
LPDRASPEPDNLARLELVNIMADIELIAAAKKIRGANFHLNDADLARVTKAEKMIEEVYVAGDEKDKKLALDYAEIFDTLKENLGL